MSMRLGEIGYEDQKVKMKIAEIGYQEELAYPKNHYDKNFVASSRIKNFSKS